MRGNSRNSTSAAGTAWPSSSAALRRLARSARRGAARPTSAAMLTATAASMPSAVGIDWV
jgi:hypothetical protein